MHQLSWRIRALATATVLAVDAATAQQLNTTTSIEKSQLHPRVATYRNGFGTHFQCTSTCYFMMWAYLACIAVLLVLLSLIPVETPRKPEHAPFVLWLDNNTPTNDDDSIVKGRKKNRPKRHYGIMDRLSMWVYGHQEPESSEIDEENESIRADVDLVTESSTPAKTFESIAVETDASLLPTLLVRTQYDVESPPPAPSPKMPGIFAPTTPRRGKREPSDLPATEFGVAQRGAASPHHQASIPPSGRSVTGRRSTVVGSASSDIPQETLLAALERRTSMHKRAEKRKEHAKSDIAHDNLHEHELHMYEYLEFVRSLLEGLSLKKITQKSGRVVKRTFYITPNLATVYWNQVGNKAWVAKKSSIESTDISRVTKGVDGQATRLTQEKQDLCLTIIMTDGKRVVLEAKDNAMRQRLVLGFTRLGVEKREEKRKKDAGETDQVPSDAAVAMLSDEEEKQEKAVSS